MVTSYPPSAARAPRVSVDTSALSASVVTRVYDSSACVSAVSTVPPPSAWIASVWVVIGVPSSASTRTWYPPSA